MSGRAMFLKKTLTTKNSQNNKSSILALFFLLMLSLMQSVLAATAYVDRNSVALNETFELTIGVSGITFSGSPDLSPLDKDFKVLGTSQRSQMNWGSGSGSSRKTEWLVSLAPLKVGTFTIPPLNIGKEKTNPLTIIVSKAPKANAANKSELFFDVEVDKSQGYVQQQIIYTMRIFAHKNFRINALSHIGDENFQDDRLSVIKLGKENRYRANIGNKKYEVIELKFLIFPQQSGKIILPAPQMIATFGGSGDPFFDRFSTRRRQQPRQVQINGEDIELNISSIPSEYTSSWWLPAKNVTFTQSWSADISALKAGEPVTRTITLQASGLRAEQLPELPQLEIFNAKVYPDKVERNTSFDGKDVIGKSVNKMLLIPSKSGEIIIPETKIVWWDIEQNRQREAVLPVQTLVVGGVITEPTRQKDVVPEPALVELDSNSRTDDLADTESLAEGSLAEDPVIITQSRWYVELGLLLVLVAVVCGWIFDRIRLQKKVAAQHSKSDEQDEKQHKERQLRKELKQACIGSSPKQVRQALINWGQQIIDSGIPVTLLQIESHFESSVLHNEIQRLENALYGNGEEGWSGANLWKAVEGVLDKSAGSEKYSGLERLHRI